MSARSVATEAISETLGARLRLRGVTPEIHTYRHRTAHLPVRTDQMLAESLLAHVLPPGHTVSSMSADWYSALMASSRRWPRYVTAIDVVHQMLGLGDPLADERCIHDLVVGQCAECNPTVTPDS